ncbi:hypothetical protein [Xanthomonas arboricola]|uniref:hypothetical protein n=1 Tax=Xanthomonas arboricola TaxID=56448 RepID=UPI0012907743|nr:hypothetical protein [Xanthomonas arboricola]
MSGPYPDQIEQIRRATSLDQIQTIARQYSAKATGEGGILYSRPVGGVSSETIAKELASKTGEPIINNTPRAQFLGDTQVEKEIIKSAERLFVQQGGDLAQAGAHAKEFLYGNPSAAARSATSLEGCLWGEASHEFAGSLRGDIKVVATNANVERVFGKVELPAVLENPHVRTLGGQPVSALKPIYASGGANAVLPQVQAQFIEAAPKGIFMPAGDPAVALTKISISSEAAATLGANAAKFSPAAELARAGLIQAPTGLAAPAASVSEAALADGAVAASRGGLRPGMAAKGATAVAVAVVAYDFVTTGHQVVKLEAQGNATGADSAKAHFVGRNVGGIGGGITVGFLAGAGYGLAGGSPSGPGALVTAGVGSVAGGIGGAFLGEKWAQQKDIERVFNQQDKDGNTWSRDPNDPKGTWTRVAQTQQVNATTTVPATDGAGTYGKVRYVAGDVLANTLNYRSANASYELGLAHVAKPQDPYSLPANKQDAKSIDGQGNWTRDAQSHVWGRTVADRYIEHGMKVSHSETASPERAAELDRAAAVIVAQNAANTPAAIAARYEVAYHQFGWDRLGQVPPALQNARAQTQSLQASDGHTYTLGANGDWTTPGTLYGVNLAAGNVRNELQATHQSQQAGLRDYAAMAAEARANPSLPQAMPMRGMVAGMYASAGITRSADEIDAATTALAQTHAREGLDRGGRPFSLTLQPDPVTGRPGPGSAIATMMDDGRDGLLSESRIVIKAITTAEQIREAAKTSPPHTPAPASGTDGKHSDASSQTAPSSNGNQATSASTATSANETKLALEHLSSTDRAIFAKVRENAPVTISDEHVAHATLLARKEGMTDPGKIDSVRMSGDTMWIAGTTPGFRVSVNTSEPAPALQETAKQSHALTQQQEQQVAQDSQQRHQDGTQRGGAMV